MSARLRAWFRSAAVVSAEAEAADGDLVRRFVDSRDEACFAELVRRHGPMVLATCRRVLHPDVHTADDAFQATFLVLATRAGAVSPPERVGAWLHGVAVRVAKKARSWARKVAPSAPSDLDRVPAVAVEVDPDAAELRAKLDDVLAGLPVKYRSAVVLCDLEQRSRAEAAGLLGWSEGTLSGRLARARKLLADRLARRGVALSVAAGGGVLLPASAAPATVPVQLAASTVRLATLVSAGGAGAASEAVPASVAALAQGVPMHSATFKFFAAGLAGLAVALGAIGAYALTAADPPVPPPERGRSLAVAAPVPKGAAVNDPRVKQTFALTAPVTAVAFGPGLVATGDREGVLTLWDAKTGKERETLLGPGQLAKLDKPITHLQFTADGANLLAVTEGGNSISRFPIEKGESVGENAFTYPAVTNYSDWKAVGVTTDGKGWLHTSQKTSAAGLSPYTPRLSVIRWFISYQFQHKDAVAHVASADATGTAVVTVSGSVKTTLRMWSRFKKEPLWESQIGQFDVAGLVVSPGGKWIAITDKAGQVRIYDAKIGREHVKTEWINTPMRAAAFSPDGKRIVVGCDDKTARVYDAETGKEIAAFKGHAGAVTAVAFGPDGKMLVTGSADKSAKVWSVEK
jgi:RNA polymerase sigma factor (sigma-70 family)